jgi:hypothetical protein
MQLLLRHDSIPSPVAVYLSRVDYACSIYEKLIRANVPISDSNSHLAYVILLTFDVGTDNFHQIMMKKIIPFIGKSRSQFLKEN